MTIGRTISIAGCFLIMILMGGCDAQGIYTGSPKSKASVLNQLDDGSFLGDNVTQLQVHQGRLYLNDIKNFRIVVFDDDLKLLRSFGQQGEGPGEFTYAGALAVGNDSVYCYDGGKRRIQVFTLDGTYHRSIPTLARSIRTSLVVDNDGNLYFSSSSMDEPITKMSPGGAVIHQFGAWFGTTDSEVQNRLRSNRYLALHGSDVLVSVGESQPVIELFSLDGALLKQVDLSDHELFKTRLAYAEQDYEEQHNERKTIAVVNGISVRGNRLYILVIRNKPNDNLSANTVVTVDLDRLEIVNIHRMHRGSGELSGWLMAIGTTNSGQVLTFDASEGGLYKY